MEGDMELIPGGSTDTEGGGVNEDVGRSELSAEEDDGGHGGGSAVGEPDTVDVTSCRENKKQSVERETIWNGMEPPDTLLDRLSLHADDTPSKVAFTFLGSGPNGGKVMTSYTYQKLEERTTALSIRLLNSSNVTAGDRVVLVYPPCMEFIVAFLACLKANLVAVPVYPPNPLRKETLRAFSGIVEGCGANVALTSEEYQHMKKLSSIKDGLAKFASRATSSSKSTQIKWPADLQWIVTDHSQGLRSSIFPADQKAANKNAPDNDKTRNGTNDSIRERICFLQYTSGSTSEPKGVMVSHGNLAHNLHIITNELQATDDTVVVSWLPQYHDMGLIGAYLGILYCGGSGYYMSPLTFLQRPMIWIEAISKYKATHVQAPNFAYKLTARKCNVKDYEEEKEEIESIKKQQSNNSEIGNDNNSKQPTTSTKDRQRSKSVPLDLSSLRHMINGAEPIDPHGMEVFHQTFEQFGLKRGVMFPTYGLAEHTLFVSSCHDDVTVLTVHKAKLEVDGIVEEKIEHGTVDGESITTEEKNQEDDEGGAEEQQQTVYRTLVGCGNPNRQHIDVRIVNPESCVEEDCNTVGEIWIRSPSKAKGYYRNPQLTQDSFLAQIVVNDGTSISSIKEESSHESTEHAKTEQEPQQQMDDVPVDPLSRYLRTGDLGFLSPNGELFICGRLKDLIIVGGRNYYPQDIEATAESVSDRIRPGCCAAFSLDPSPSSSTTVKPNDKEATEEVALLMELRDIPPKNELDDICNKLISSVQSTVKLEHSLGITHFVLLEPRTIPKTTSGKIARAFCRKAYLTDTLKRVYTKHFSADSTEVTYDKGGPGEENGANGATSANLEKRDEQDSEMNRKQTSNVQMTAEDIRSLSNETILKKLKSDIARMSQTLPDEIANHAPLITVLDSLSLSQFKGMLEAEYFTTLSDEYLFRESTSTLKLVEVVKLGYAPDDSSGGGTSGVGANGTSANRPHNSHPASQGAVGQQGGIAGAMGCPPGVVCCSIM